MTAKIIEVNIEGEEVAKNVEKILFKRKLEDSEWQSSDSSAGTTLFHPERLEIGLAPEVASIRGSLDVHPCAFHGGHTVCGTSICAHTIAVSTAARWSRLRLNDCSMSLHLPPELLDVWRHAPILPQNRRNTLLLLLLHGLPLD